MNKRQVISLRLAQWLGRDEVRFDADKRHAPVGFYGHDGWYEFNPFENSTEGRAQFAEIIEKCGEQKMQVSMHPRGCCAEFEDGQRYFTTPKVFESTIPATLEVIFFAIGGKDTWSQK